jgi:hypothetical protein
MSARFSSLIVAVITAASLAALATRARADAIDGDWCFDDGRRFSIHGPAITTPGGTATAGNYGRHSFHYVVPKGEESAGNAVEMLLLNENTVQLEASGQTEIWLRCKPEIS